MTRKIIVIFIISFIFTNIGIFADYFEWNYPLTLTMKLCAALTAIIMIALLCFDRIKSKKELQNNQNTYGRMEFEESDTNEHPSPLTLSDMNVKERRYISRLLIVKNIFLCLLVIMLCLEVVSIIIGWYFVFPVTFALLAVTSITFYYLFRNKIEREIERIEQRISKKMD